MTQSTAEIRHVVARTGFANPLTLGVLVEDADYLKVYADTELLQVGVDYTVTGIGDANGVSVEIIGAEDINEYVGVETFTALYDPVLQQGSDLSLGGSFGRAFESALDSQNRQLQAVDDRVNRALKLPVSVGGDIVLDDPVDGWGLVWDDDTQAFIWAAVNDAGASAASLPPGGTMGQLLAKASDSDFDVEWIEGAFTADAISFTPTGGLSATDVQAALAELDSEKLSAAAADALFLTPAEGNAAYQPLDADLTALGGLVRVRGDLIRGGASAWERYAIGAAGYALKSDGTDIVWALDRELLLANRTYYVRADGSDSNNGLADTSGGAFLTIQKAVNTAYGLDLNGFNVTIQVADGTYTAGAALAGPFVGKGNVSIVGNTTTPANVAVNVTSANAFQATYNAIVTIKGFKVTTTTAGSALYAAYGGIIFHDKMDFGSCASSHITASDFGEVAATLLSTYTISGSAVSHVHSLGGGIVVVGYNTITLTGTPAFSSYFVGVADASVNFEGTTFSGSATGVRFVVYKRGYINTNFGGLTFFPGNAAGTINPGGFYDYSSQMPAVTYTANFTVGDGDTDIINDKTGSTCTVTLPSASLFFGRKLFFNNEQAQALVSASSNVVPKTGGAAGTAILPATGGAWAMLSSNGAYWKIMMSGT